MLISQEREDLSKVTQGTPLQHLPRETMTSVPSRPNGLNRCWTPLRKTMLDSNPLSNPSEAVNVHEIVHSTKEIAHN